MTKHHKATPEQWAYAETCAPEDFAGYACILELRARIEALEAAQQPQQDKLDRLIAIDRDDPANSLVERIATDAELFQAYNDAPEHGFGPALRAVYDLGRRHGPAYIRSGPAGSAPDTDARQLTLVPVSERPWEREGWCDAEGQCWWLRPADFDEDDPALAWYLDGSPAPETCWEIHFYGYTHSLPHHALPTPEAPNG
jgi:hypothetical protein